MIVLRSLVIRSGNTTSVNGVTPRLVPTNRTALVDTLGVGKSLICVALTGTLPASLEVAGSSTIEPDNADVGSDLSVSPPVGGEDDGVNLLRLPAALRPRGSCIAPVPQDHSTILRLLIAVGRQITLVSQVVGHTRDGIRQRATDYLHAVGPDKPSVDHVPGRLSGDQRQRVGPVLALAIEPVLIAADEPTTALDITTHAEILELLSSLTSLP